MLTMKEIREVNALIEQRHQIEKILKSFNSPYVKCSMGLIDLNSASPEEPKPCDEAKLFHLNFPQLVKDLNNKATEAIKFKIKEIDLQLSKYVKEGEE